MITDRVGNNLDLEAVIEFYRASTLGERRPVDDKERMRDMLQNANLVVTAWDGDLMVGIARSVSDFSYATYLSDLAVRLSHQKQGIGRELIRQTQALGGHDGILKLVSSFYADVRQHAVIGPIFNAQIKDWSAHLAEINEFWVLQTGGKSKYGGGFAGAHMKLGLKPEHFQNWLDLWEYNNARHLAPSEAAEMNELAHRFASRLFAVTQRYGIK